MNAPRHTNGWTHTAVELAALIYSEPDRRRRRRLLALWHLRRGDRVETAAKAAGVSTRTVLRWLALYRRSGLDALLHQVPGHQAKGRPARLSTTQIAELRMRADSGDFRTVADAVAWVRTTWSVDYTYQGMYALLSRRPRPPRDDLTSGADPP
jgi:transposase